MGTDPEKDFLDNIIDSVIVVDKEGKVREVNQTTLKLLGYKRREEIIELAFEKICKNFSVAGLKDKLPLSEQELIYLNKEGEKIPVSVNITDRIVYPDDIIFMARDISKIKDLISELTQSREDLRTSYTELKVSKDELVRTEKLAFTGRIAAGIAHEIRNPLANVYMSVERLKKTFKPEDVVSKDVEMLTKNVERINYLITELLNCARPPKLNLRSHDIHRSLRKILEFAKTKIRAQGIKVTKRLTSKPSKMKIDRDQIERVLSNIIINAIESMPRGGKLTIATEINENFFVVKVEDTGKGIPEKDIIRIFDPFFSTKSQGVGLGLTLCYGIVASHGGTIEVESKRRKGTTFTVSLPIKEEVIREREREREDLSQG